VLTEKMAQLKLNWMDIQTEILNWLLISNHEYFVHPKSKIGIVAQFNAEADLVLNPNSIPAAQYLHPNEVVVLLCGITGLRMSAGLRF
jgi:hypothetical protein